MELEALYLLKKPRFSIPPIPEAERTPLLLLLLGLRVGEALEPIRLAHAAASAHCHRRGTVGRVGATRTVGAAGEHQ